jgi:Ca2+-binding EF-hand superfamily protein
MSSELTSWQASKFKDLFDLFDSDGKGTTDESELEAAMERLQLDTGWPENSRVLSHVKARWNVFMRGLFRDSPILSEQRWLDFLGKFLKQDRERRAEDSNHRGGLEELGQLLFLLLDRDRNSLIDYQEFLIFFYALGRKDRHAEDSFEKLDTDEDGFLSKSEMEDMTLEYFHSTQPGSVGDWLFGPPPVSAS